MIRIFRFLLLFFVLLLVRAIIRSIFASVRSYAPPPAKSPEQPAASTGGELKKDPVCGTYVSVSGSLTRTVNGQVVYFCSSQCRDKYQTA